MLWLLLFNYLIRSGKLDKQIFWLKNTYRRQVVRVSGALPIVLILGLLVVEVQAKGHSDSLPIPRNISNQLFYLQRDPDANTVVYQLNLKNGQVDERQPINAFWIRYAERGQIEELSSVQKKLAYGIRSRLIAKGKHELHFVSYPRLPLYLLQTGEKYQVYAMIQQKMLLLDKIFVHVSAKSFIIPKVESIELWLRDEAGKSMTHSINI